MSNPTVNELSVSCSVIISTKVDPVLVETALELCNIKNRNVGEHHAAYLCDEIIVTSNLKEDQVSALRSYFENTGLHVITFEQMKELKTLYPYHWLLEFNYDGTGHIFDTKGDFKKEFSKFDELFNT